MGEDSHSNLRIPSPLLNRSERKKTNLKLLFFFLLNAKEAVWGPVENFSVFLRSTLFLTHLFCELLCVPKYADMCKHTHRSSISIYLCGKSCIVCIEAAFSAF